MSSRFRRPATLIAWCWVVAQAPGPSTASAAHPAVAAFERFRADWTPEQSGRLLLAELNCRACHRDPAEADDPVGSRQAPILDRVGERVRPEYLRRYLADPHAAKPGSTMPDLIAALPEAERAPTVEALVHFLAATGTPKHARVNRQAAGRGADLYRQVGCAACHGDLEPGSEPLATSVPLGDLAAKYSLGGLTAFLQEPHKVRPSGRMPSLNLRGPEAAELASYLLRDQAIELPAVLTYQAYEGNWSELPDFDGLTPAASGQAEAFDPGLATRKDNVALRFEGTFNVAQAGEYAFRLDSDDGSRLTVDGELVVDNDGIHPARKVGGRRRLEPGPHKLVLTYFNAGGEVSLETEVRGPGLAPGPIEAILDPIAPAADRPAPFRPDPALIDQGRSAFAALGCASCHRLGRDDEAIASTLEAPALAVLDPARGCLAGSPAGKAPRFGLDQAQRTALAAVVGPAAAAAPRTPPHMIAATLASFNCYACHQRDGLGGVEPGRDAFFATTQKEMGDEGRLPPPLDGVGGKLTRAWLGELLEKGSKDRPYMLTRMPRFGEGSVAHLAPLFETADALEPYEAPDLGEPDRKVKAAGRLLVGNKGLSCVSCHTFNNSKAAGIQAIDLSLMGRRLRTEWFSRYVVNPPRFRPGTRMPSSWFQGKSGLTSVYDGEAARQVEAIWTYLQDGPKAAPPSGIGRDPIPLVATTEAVIYRNFIEGAGPRAIGVGYPEKANLAFDANGLRLALIWQGDFIDASRHWIGRGEGYQPPLGDSVLPMPPGPGFARLTSPSAAWPAPADRNSLGKFRGYRVDAVQRPTFLYEIGPVRVEDHPEAVAAEGGPSLRRTLTLTAGEPVENLFFRPVVAGKIEPAGDGWYTVDGDWKVRLRGGEPPIVRESNGKAELLIPIRVEDRPITLLQEITW